MVEPTHCSKRVVSAVVWINSRLFPANSGPLSLPYLHANPPGTTGLARILRISPRLPPCQPIHHLSRSKCGGMSHPPTVHAPHCRKGSGQLGVSSNVSAPFFRSPAVTSCSLRNHSD